MILVKIEQHGDDLVAKIIEEAGEIADAVFDGESKERVLSECFDNIQSTWSFMHDIATEKEIELAAARHVKKLRDRGHNILEYYTIRRVV